MVMMHGLRILTELSFYYAFASFVAVGSGSRYALLGLLVQTLCGTLSAMLNKKVIRLVALLPMAVLWLLPDLALADTLLFIPAAAYLVWQAHDGSSALEWGRQVELFSVFWKVYAAFACLMLLTGMAAQLSRASLPIALIMLVASVLLMRSLRHDPETYCQKWYQLCNAATVAVVMAAAAVISSDVFLNTCLSALSAGYKGIVLPLLMLGLSVFFYILQGLAWLVSLLNIQLPENENPPELQLKGIAEELGIVDLATESPLGKEFMIFLCVVAVSVLLYFFFRWMKRLGWGVKQPPEVREERINIVSDEDNTTQKVRLGGAVQRVRAQYRKFLKLYVSVGGELDPTHTSLDVERDAKKKRFDPSAAEELRSIYIRARYAEQAEGQDVSRAKELYALMKKERRS